MKRALFLAVPLVLLAPTMAHAIGVDPGQATPVQREQAQARFIKGKQKYDAGDYAAALEEFQGSIDIVQSPNTRLYVARCFREMKKLVEAYVEFGRTMVEAKEHAAADGRYAKAAEAAAAERNAIEPYLGFVTVNVQNPTDETKLYVGETEIKRGGWPEPIPVMPGSAEVRVVTPGRDTATQKLTLQQGDKQSISIAVPAAKAIEPPPPPPPPEKKEGNKIFVPLAVAAGGVAVVGFTMFAIGGIASMGTYSDLEKTCGKNTPCPESLKGTIDRGRTEQAIANVGLFIGIAGAVAGGALLTFALLPSSSKTQANLTVGPSSITLGGTF